jgi:hypothetical protein
MSDFPPSDGKKFMAWINSLETSSVAAMVTATQKHLEGKGVTGFGVVGFCWGSSISLYMASMYTACILLPACLGVVLCMPCICSWVHIDASACRISPDPSVVCACWRPEGAPRVIVLHRVSLLFTHSKLTANMSGRGKGRKGLGKGGAKRHRRVLRVLQPRLSSLSIRSSSHAPHHFPPRRPL